jgi:POT family proton-dependent oligopeptide transporter
MMGAWFLSTAAGNFLAAKIAQMTGGEGAGPDRVLEVYQSIGWYIIVIGVIAIPVSWLVTRLMHLDQLEDDDLAGQREAGIEAMEGGLHPATIKD